MPSSCPPYHTQQQHSVSQTLYNIAHNVTDALRNPYTQVSSNQLHGAYSAHYANAYLQSQQAVRTTPEGYTLSSTYDPTKDAYRAPRCVTDRQSTSSNRGRGQVQILHRVSNHPRQNIGSWYHPGNSRCSYPGCTFTGSHNSVEIHMMDRHLIYPPNWDKRKKTSDWDTDPSLKGKTIPIQGTSILFNTPEAFEIWTVERKKRWPTAQRVEEKKTRMKEAIARGQLPLVTGDSQGTKRRYEEGKGPQRNNKRPRQITGHQDKRSNPSQAVSVSVEASSHGVIASQSSTSPKDAIVPASWLMVQSFESGESDSDDNGPPEIASSKQSAGKNLPDIPDEIEQGLINSSEPTLHPIPNAKNDRPRVKQPRLLPRNPFASRSTLLRNLIMPEIRITVSNLSQVVRFLVDNDFLRDVELKPGLASQNLIEVLNSQSVDETPSYATST